MSVEVVKEPSGQQMECPRCEKEGIAKSGLNICSRCGTEFVVE